jgi:class 3 adenylate cyclase
MLASMSQTEWSDVGMSDLLPTGMVTFLLADVEGSTRLWETQSDDMAAAVSRLDRTLAELVGPHNGVRPVEQGEGDSSVIAFPRQRCGRVRIGPAAGAAGAGPVAR